jgi:integration host factor subunit alpha
MTKKDLIDSIVEEMNYSRKEATELVDTFFETMKSKIEQEGKLKISRFGSFEVYRKKERIGRNPKTMEEARIGARNVVRFKGSSILRNSINK